MSQYNLPAQFAPHFVDGLPRLVYAWYDFDTPPRILHRHEGITELMLYVGGGANLTIDEQTYPVKAGDIVALNAGVPHDEDAIRSTQTATYGVGLTDLQLYGLPPNAILAPDICPVSPLGADFARMRGLFETIYALLQENPPRHAETCQLLAASLALLFVRQFSHHAPVKPMDSSDKMLTTRIRNYIEQHYSEDLSLPAIGKALHISSYYLAHVFKDSTGYSPMQYVIRLRIGRAQELLSSTTYPITQIAGMVGYDNPSHFNTMFTKNIGMSPGKYRKTIQQQE